MALCEAGLIEDVMVELGSLAATFDTVGAEYARQYAAHVQGGQRAPRVPHCLPRGFAAAIREVVLDAAMLDRRLNPELAQTNQTGDPS